MVRPSLLVTRGARKNFGRLSTRPSSKLKPSSLIIQRRRERRRCWKWREQGHRQPRQLPGTRSDMTTSRRQASSVESNRRRPPRPRRSKIVDDWPVPEYLRERKKSVRLPFDAEDFVWIGDDGTLDPIEVLRQKESDILNSGMNFLTGRLRSHQSRNLCSTKLPRPNRDRRRGT